MIDFRTLHNIRKKAIKKINLDSNGKTISDRVSKLKFNFFFYGLPIIMAIVPWILSIGLTQLTIYVTTGVSIFTSLFFSLLLSVSSRIRTEKSNKDIDLSNYEAFKESLKQISSITLYIILLGVQIMLVVVLNYIFSFKCNAIELSFTSIAFFLLSRYFVCLLAMLQRFFFVIRDEIDNIM